MTSGMSDGPERVLEGFLATHPEAAPVVSQNTEDGTLTIAFTLDAPDGDVHEALSRCEAIALDGLRASKLRATKIAAVHAVALEADEVEPATELQPA